IGVTALVTVRSAGAAGASGREVDVSLTYQAPEGCPSRDLVVEQLGSRGLRVKDAGAERRLSIDVAPRSADGHRFKGTLTIEGSTGRPALSQSVSGQDCRAVTQSLALVAALALNPNVDAAPENPPAGTVAAGRPADDVPGLRPPWFVGASGRGMSALGSGPAVGLSVFGERVWGPKLHAALSMVFSATTAAPPTINLMSGSADLRAYLGRLEGCWFGGILAAEPIVVSPCAGIEGGALQGTGNIDRPRTATRPWVAPVLSARALAAVTRAVWVSLELTAFSPIVRDTFVFTAPRSTIYRSPVLGGGLELGLAGAFW
ncbi:MAG TPA: hypothetical protein VFH73_02425, partial [Polyangia bacterium]|nr:hypothetical protein [Polyangia bacterium]